ncbi:transporter substrate-binding domain-containing protein [Corynebacterium sp. Q4381]|uniref:transporter substrate-binding domain-containing protein n=1 Tax=Corynebacterium sp. Marseille-Q4381 TaxID=3121597 RepID=UPI002FE5DC56
MHRAIRRAAASVVTAAAALTLAACSGSDGNPEAEGLLARIESGEVTVGMREDTSAMGKLDEAIATHVINAIAKDRGWDAPEITWAETLPAKREEMLTSGEVDMVAAAYSIYQERAEKVSFAGPYAITHQALLIAAGNTEIDGLNDLRGKVVCSATGSWSAQMILTTQRDTEVRERDTYTECVDELRSGRVDGVTTDELILQGYAANNPGEFRIVELVDRGTPLTMERYGIGVRKDDTQVTDEINKALGAMLDDGTFDRLTATHMPDGVEVEKDVPGDLAYLN